MLWKMSFSSKVIREISQHQLCSYRLLPFEKGLILVVCRVRHTTQFMLLYLYFIDKRT